MNSKLETKGTRGTFETFRRAAPAGLRLLCEGLRALIVSLDEDCVEVVWPRQRIASFGVGPRKMTEHYAYLGIQASYVNLGFYHGVSLRDPSGMLEGSGKRLRHVKIRDASQIENRAIRALLRDAIDDRKRHQGGA